MEEQRKFSNAFKMEAVRLLELGETLVAQPERAVFPA